MLGHWRKRFKREEEERKNWNHVKGLLALCMDNNDNLMDYTSPYFNQNTPEQLIVDFSICTSILKRLDS
jgi:hypothetical protein